MKRFGLKSWKHRSRGECGQEGYLNKNEVPYLKARRVIIINQLCSITTTKPVIMYFSARSTRTSVAHLPEIILFKKNIYIYMNFSRVEMKQTCKKKINTLLIHYVFFDN